MSSKAESFTFLASAYHYHNTSNASNESSDESIIEDRIETEVIKSPHDIRSYVSIKVKTSMPALAIFVISVPEWGQQHSFKCNN